jgi:hypothetical protein
MKPILLPFLLLGTVLLSISGLTAQTSTCNRRLDSLELVKLYNATNGPNWTNKWDMSRPMNTWYGIRLNTQGCVQCIDMDGTVDCSWSLNPMGNNLSGVLPDLSFSALTALVLSGNRISGIIPNFNMPNLWGLFLYNNRLTFKDILPNISFAQTASFVYTPQDSVFRDTTFTGIAGRALTIDLGIDAGISTNVYSWYKNGQIRTVPTGNSINSNKLIFSALRLTDAGTYQVWVTNSGAPLLTLYGRRVRIQVNCAGGAMSLSSSGLLCAGSSITLTAPAGFAQYRWSTGAVTNTVTASSNGTYAVTVTDVAGCTASATA